LGYRAISNQQGLNQSLENFASADEYKAFDQNAAVIEFLNGQSALVFNGYRSLTFGPAKKTVLHEMIVGATPALFSKDTKQALVLGLGTGITAGSTATLYDHVDVAEINPAMLNILPHFREEHQNLTDKPHVSIQIEDGITKLLTSSKTYDAIINTVTSPHYYAASKLYTRDFYNIAKSRLSDGGVYSGWFDVSIGQDGITMMLNTLEASFESCRYFLMANAYFNVVCRDGDLFYRSSSQIDERLAQNKLQDQLKAFGLEIKFYRLMPQLELSFEDAFFPRRVDDINTLDRPIIEFAVAHDPKDTSSADALVDLVTLNIDERRKTSFGESDWIEKCQIISVMAGYQFEGCE